MARNAYKGRTSVGRVVRAECGGARYSVRCDALYALEPSGNLRD